MFSDPPEWAGALNLDIWLSGIAKGRGKPANFELLFSLAGQVPNTRSQERILTYLAERQVRRGTGGIIFEYPGYDNLPIATRDKLLKVVSAADRTKFRSKGVELLDRLKEELSNPKAVWFSAEEKAEVEYTEAIRHNPNDDASILQPRRYSLSNAQ